MINMPYAFVTSTRLIEQELLSARPHAPVRTVSSRDVVRPRAFRTRRTVAAMLHRAADSVAPTHCTPSPSI